MDPTLLCLLVRLQNIRNINEILQKSTCFMFIITNFVAIIILKETDFFRTYNVEPISHQRKTSTYVQMQTYVTVCVEIIAINA